MKLFLMILLFSNFVWAYIPSTAFIFDRVASLHGKGVYKISADVIFTENGETQLVKENWIILDGGEMQVTARGDGFQLSRLLKRGKIYWTDQNGQEHASENLTSGFMSALLIRTPMELKRFFIRWNVLPIDVLKEIKLPKEAKDIVVESEPFVKLGRVNGAVQYQFGKPDGPALWIEQDHFFITKMRTPSGAEFLGQNYFIYARNLAFPKTQTVFFNGKKVEIKVTAVSGVTLGNDVKKQMEHQEKTVWPTHSLSNTVQEFYKNFR